MHYLKINKAMKSKFTNIIFRNKNIGFAILMVLGSTIAQATTYTVTSLSDAGSGSGTNGDLRYCINQVNGSAGPHTINISLAGTITLTSNLPGINQRVTINGTSAPGYALNAPVVQIRGNNVANNTILFNASAAANSILIGLCINSAINSNVLVQSVNNVTIQDCFIGTNLAGTATGLASQQTGILANSSSGLKITNCVVSGNAQCGINLISASNDCIIKGCRVGVNNTGTIALSNGQEGISLSQCLRTIIGGSLVSERNIISGNGYNGIFVYDVSDQTVITNNYIGTNASGTVAIPNISNGINLYNSDQTSIQNNLISGNNLSGIEIQGGSLTTTVNNNLIGINSAGISAVPNNSNGIYVHAASDGNTITNNTISGNNGFGFFAYNTNNFTITGNNIGTTASNVALGNGVSGLFFQNYCANIQIGGNSASTRNVISANTQNGMQCDDNCSNVKIQGNYIGTDNNGGGNPAIYGNGEVGIILSTSTSGSLIGGSASGEGNVISGNGRLFNNASVQNGSGIYMAGNCTNTLIKGNIVGLQADGVTAMGNAKNGIELLNGCNGFDIGGNTSLEKNLISSNGTKFPGIGQGLVIYQSNTGKIRGNYFGTDYTGTVVRGNEQSGMVIIFSTDVEIGRAFSGEGNLISNNKELGIHIVGGARHIIYNNKIGISSTSVAMGNGSGGIFILGVSTSGTDMVVGGTASLQPNVIAYSTGTGPAQFGNGFGVGVANNDYGNKNSIIGNSIYCNAGEGIDLNTAGSFGGAGSNGIGNNGKAAPVISASTANTVTGTGTNGDLIHIYRNNTSGTGCGCEGEVYLGTTLVSGGTWSFTHGLGLTAAQALLVSATATDAINNTSPFTCNIPLPVDLIYFNAEVRNANGYLYWATSSEANNDRFLLQKSTDGNYFETIAVLKGKGSFNGISEYSFTDSNLVSEINYYRLVQIDYDGEKNISEIRLIKQNGNYEIIIYPNPFSGDLKIFIPEIEKASFILYDVVGQKLSDAIEYTTSEELYTLYLQDLSPGIYMLGVNTLRKTKMLKIIKK
jgi:parallel beta-helix repeat protein